MIPPRQPHVILILLAAVLVGIVNLARLAPAPASVEQLYQPAWMRAVWAGLLFLGGVAGLAGVAWAGRRHVQRVLTGWALEAFGLAVSAGGWATYATGVLGVNGGKALLPGTLATAITVANTWRAIQIRANMRLLENGGS